MNYKKTFWMNVVAVVLAFPFSIATYKLHVAEHGTAHLPLFYFGYSLVIATPLLTAIALKSNGFSIIKWTAIILNSVGVLFFLRPLYEIYVSTPYMRIISIADAILVAIFILIPCLINLKALRKS